MNIIQVQDRLKGVTDDALIGYVENPTGQVPTYLALGEIGRREKMRKEYQAQPQSTQTVAEEMIAQVSTPTGIGALTDNMAPRMAPEEVMSTSETISETGIAPLPTPNMPQNFERGGIVGYGPGGPVDYLSDLYDDISEFTANSNPSFASDLPRRFPDDNLPGFLGDPTNIFLGDPEEVKAPGDITSQFAAETETIRQAPVTKARQSELARDLKNEENLAEARNRKARRDQRKEEVAPSKTMADYVAEFKTSLGDDPLRKKMEERMAKMDERAEKSEKNALFDSMITAGLTMAAGKDQNAISNIAVGALRGVKTYEDALEARDVLDEKQLTLQMQMSKADRAEQIAAIEYGMQSRQFQETQDLKASIAAQSSTIDLMKIQIDNGEFGEKIKKNKADVYKDIIDQDGPAVEAFIEDWFESSGREYDVKDPQFIVAYENFMDKKVADRRGEKGRIPTPGFRLVP